jgi:hypothetical protein
VVAVPEALEVERFAFARLERLQLTDALVVLAEAYGHDDVAQILDEWLNDRPDDTSGPAGGRPRSRSSGGLFSLRLT